MPLDLQIRVDLAGAQRELLLWIGDNIGGERDLREPGAPPAAEGRTAPPLVRTDAPSSTAFDPAPDRARDLAPEPPAPQRPSAPPKAYLTLVGLREPATDTSPEELRALLKGSSAPAEGAFRFGSAGSDPAAMPRTAGQAEPSDAPVDSPNRGEPRRPVPSTAAAAFERPVDSPSDSAATRSMAARDGSDGTEIRSRQALSRGGAATTDRPATGPEAASARGEDASEAVFADHLARLMRRAGADPATGALAARPGSASPADLPSPADARAPAARPAPNAALAFAEPFGIGTGAMLGAGAATALPHPDLQQAVSSFVLNASMIPGWPPPRPLEGVALKAFVGQLTPSTALTESDKELLLYLAQFGVRRRHIRRWLRKVATARDRSKLLLAASALLTNLQAAMRALADEVAALSDELEDAETVALGASSGRTRLRLR